MRLRNEADEKNDRLKVSVDTTSVLVDGGYGFGDFMDVLFGSGEETKSIRRRSIIAAKEKRALKARDPLRLNPSHGDFVSDLPYLTVGFSLYKGSVVFCGDLNGNGVSKGQSKEFDDGDIGSKDSYWTWIY